MSGVTSDTLRKLAALKLNPEQMSGVLELLADVQLEDERRKADLRARVAKCRAKKRNGNVTVTLPQGGEPPLEVPLPLETPTPPISPQSESKGNGRARVESDWPEDYREQVWQAYGQGREKKVGIAKLDEVRKSRKVPWLVLMAAIQRQAETVEPQFRPSLERFLRKERWLDDFLPAEADPLFEPRPTKPSLRVIHGTYRHAQPDQRKSIQAAARDLDIWVNEMSRNGSL